MYFFAQFFIFDSIVYSICDILFRITWYMKIDDKKNAISAILQKKKLKMKYDEGTTFT